MSFAVVERLPHASSASSATAASPVIGVVRPVLKSVAAFAIASVFATCASAATLSKSVEVQASPDAVWSFVGPFCAIKDWLPPVGSCAEDGKPAPTRTLVTKDGTATFVELRTAHSDSKHLYSYTFVSSPVPVTHYSSTIQVIAHGDGFSTVTWSSTYTPDPGKEKDASETLSGIYDAGLEGIKAHFKR